MLGKTALAGLVLTMIAGSVLLGSNAPSDQGPSSPRRIVNLLSNNSDRTSDLAIGSSDMPLSLERKSAAVASVSWTSIAAALPQGCTPPSGVIISEVRLRGPAGADDEFIEFYNLNGFTVTICTADGSTGWALVSSDGTTRFIIPAGTVIPAQGHFLAAGSSYSLSTYASPDQNYSLNIPDNTGIALFNTSNPANFNTSTRLDAVGFTTDTNTLYREGAGLTPLSTANDQFTLLRSLASGGVPLDTNNNAADFQYLSATAATGAKLGAPGPENFWSPIQRNNQFSVPLLDATVGASVAPNRVRDLTSDPANNSTYGTLSIRRRIVNNTGAPITNLRFRVVNVTTYPVPSGTADIRVRSSSAFVQMNINDANTCAATGTPATPPCTVTVQGTLLEQPPNQTLGGGFNSTLSVALPQPLAASASVNVQFLLGLEQTGFFQFFFNIEAMPENGANLVDPANRTGGGDEDPFSRNFNWSIPLVELPGRAGLDLGLSLAYNSLVWTKTGSFISFDDDHGFPSPGFRLGFPVIQPYYNVQLGKNGYLFLASDGTRVELRQVGTSNLYQAVDSSYLLLNNSTMKLRTADGTELSYVWQGSDFQCTEMKDRNGNYLTINYTDGRVDTVVDTLNRTIKFNYDGSDALTSITQTWTVNGSPVTHTWASFQYRNPNLTINTNFTGLTNVGPQNGSTLKVLSRVTLADNSRFEFDYTSWGQVWKISQFAIDGQTLLNYRSYNLPLDNTTAATDCPRFTQRRDWAKYWNLNQSGVEQEAITSFIVPVSPTSWLMPDGTQQSGTLSQVTMPDGTYHKIYSHSTGWDKGLPLLTETYDNAQVRQRQVTTAWTQDDPALPVPLNPRVTEVNAYDPAGNRKRTRTTYQQLPLPDGTTCSLPQDVFEYQANASDVLRSARTTYNTDSAYTSRRIIGLVSERALYEGDVTVGGVLVSKFSFHYDEAGSIQGTDAPVQHANPTFVTGRANLSSVKRYDVNSTSQVTTSTMKYNTAGSIVSSKNTLDHEVKFSYVDSFSDGVSRNTLAYPTKITDPDNYWSSSIYNFDFGAVTQTETPPPNVTGTPNPQPTGPRRTFTYDNLGRLERTTSLVNNSYTRFEYKPNGIRVDTYATIQQGLGEAHSFSIRDGAGRVIASASHHPATPGTTARFDAVRTAYDIVGRVSKTSNPAETSALGDDPAQWQLVEGDAGSNWQALFTQYSYDWKGGPKTITNTDTTTKSVTYEGCGCAGGEVVTLTDEGTIVNGVNKTRQKKIYSDFVGRTVKSEVWNFEGTGSGGVGRALYSTTVTNYNARDQVTLVRQFKGAAPTNYLTDLSCPTGTCQKSEFTYDGYGRLQTKHVPEQRQNPYVVTSLTYNADDTVNTVTDGRGAVTEYGYGTSGNNRRLVKTISHTLSGSLPITVNFDYDAAGNRKSMSHSINGVQQDSISYTYDQLSRLTSETRHVNALANSATGGNYTIGYQYNLGGQLSSVTDPFGSTTNLNYDAVGRTESVTGSYAGVNYTYANDIEYRAWGAVKRQGVKTITYNNRLQPTQFRFFQYRYDYNYHPDGQLKHLTDLDDVVGQPSQVTFHYMSRDYGYDHAGRLSRVDATDNPIVNGGLVPAPFVGNYGYDEFDNLNSRTGYYALNPNTSASATFVDNKRTNTGWSYDADGRVLTSVDTATGTSQTWSYDAAGRKIGISEVSSGTTSTSTLSYDGYGKLLYESVTTPQSTKADYLIWSTVLGSILTKLDALGNKDITYVPANGLAFPMQTKDFNGNPTVGGVSRDVTGLQEDGKAVDPFGALIHNVQPPTSGSPPPIPFYGPQYGNTIWSQFTNSVNYSTGCVLDGQRIDCNEVRRRINDGFVDFSVPSGLTDSTRYDPQRLPGYFETRGESGHTRFFITGPVFSEPESQNPTPTPKPPCPAQDFSFNEGANGLTTDELSEISQAAVGESSVGFAQGESSTIIDTIYNRLSTNLYGDQKGWVLRDQDGMVTHDINAFSGRNALSVNAILRGYDAATRRGRDGLRSGERKIAQAKALNNGVLPADSDACKQLLEARSNASRVGDAIKYPGTGVNRGVNSNLGIGPPMPANFNLLFTIGNTRFGRRPVLAPRPRRR